MDFPSDKVVQISNFDGQTVYGASNAPIFEVGNFLGGGAAGTVYECEYVKTRERYALKVLNPLGYKILTPALLKKCSILTKGRPVFDESMTMTKENLWWLLNSGTKQYISAFYNEKQNCLKELSLNQCLQIWSENPADLIKIDDDNPGSNLEVSLLPSGQRIFVPLLPPKFVEFIRKRLLIFREINNMRKISNHVNVIRLEGVLELVQDSKCTIFLVMELANGGELFDRIKVDCGTREETAKFFFQQLLLGVKHCHDQGVCHRDLKPENLLLQDTSDKGTILKIADFGFSARFAMAGISSNDDNWNISQKFPQDISDGLASSPVRVLKSIVGSPFYVAPEILQARGYDGSKADIWSLGVILYAMLAGNLPFGQDLTLCKRFKTFCKWVRQYNLKATQLWDHPSLDFPDWLFPSKFSIASKGLIVSMLHPDPMFRISVAEAMTHPLCIPPPKVVSALESMVPRQEDNILDNIDEEETDKNDNSIEEEKDSDYDDQSGVFTMEEDIEELMKLSPQKSDSTPAKIVTTISNRGYSALYTDTVGLNQSRSFTMLSGLQDKSSFILGSSPPGAKPPIAPHVIPNSIDDLITHEEQNLDIDDETDTNHLRHSTLFDSLPPKGPLRRERSDDSNNHPPSFNDAVKRSTRFITAVPAFEVIAQVEKILLDCKDMKVITPIGLIGRVELNWETFRLDVWGQELSSPSVCALQLYQLPSAFNYSTPSTPSRSSGVFISQASTIPINVSNPATTFSSSPYSGSFGALHSTQDLYLVEFVRGQLEIFAFKRFYQWLRQRLSEIVKKDYSSKHYEYSVSPK